MGVLWGSWAVGSRWQGWQMAQLSLSTSPTPPGVAPSQSSLPAPGRAAVDMPGVLGLSVHREAVSPASRDVPPACKPASSHSSPLLPSLVTASWSCLPYLTRKPRSFFPKESSRRTSRRARSTCVTPRSQSEGVCPSIPPGCRSFHIRSLPCAQLWPPWQHVISSLVLSP